MRNFYSVHLFFCPDYLQCFNKVLNVELEYCDFFNTTHSQDEVRNIDTVNKYQMSIS